MTTATVSPHLFSDLQNRGITKQVTHPELEKAMRERPLTLYCGFDPTSDSLHAGSLLPLLTLRRFQQAGHRVIAVVGGATGMIGDPSGKTQERQLLTPQLLARNLDGIRGVIQKFLVLDGPNPARLMNNADWFEGMSYVDFLRDVGKHFTVNHMLAKESVRGRLEDREHGISYTEFSYMLLQAYDFHVLHRDHGCSLQIGGSDQWGNITAGVDLIRRMRVHGTMTEGAAADAEPAFGLTWPLLTKADGTKFGKTESGNVWLDPVRTTPFQFHQYWMQTADADVPTLLRYFSFRPLEEIERLIESSRTNPERREAQQALADELTALVHGSAEVEKVKLASQALFGGGDLRSLGRAELLALFKEAPSTKLPRTRLADAPGLIDLLAETGLCASKGAARKDLQGGGISLNQERMSDPMRRISEADLIAGEFLVLRKGKKTYHLVAFE